MPSCYWKKLSRIEKIKFFIDNKHNKDPINPFRTNTKKIISETSDLLDKIQKHTIDYNEHSTTSFMNKKR